MFILNKVIPEGFVLEDEVQRNMVVHIVTKDSEKDGLSYEEQTKLIKEVENEPDTEDDDWGNEIYTPRDNNPQKGR